MESLIKDSKKIKLLLQVLVSLRKIGEDLKFEITDDFITLRTLNSTTSALPVITLKQPFFTHYRYFHSDEQILFQVPVQYVIAALRSVTNAESLSFKVEETPPKLSIGLKDRDGISHTWEVFTSDATVICAVYKIESAPVFVECRCDVFDGMASAFKGNENIFLEVKRLESQQTGMQISSAVESNLATSLSISNSDHMISRFKDESSQIRLKFSLADFIVAIKLSSILSQKMEIYLLEPGYPVVIKSTMHDQMSFEIALATATDEYNDDSELSDVTPTAPESYNGPQVSGPSFSQSDRSQTGPWIRGPAPELDERVPEIVEERKPKIPVYDNTLAAFSDSAPGFTLKRKRTGLYAENSQPQSDESEYD